MPGRGAVPALAGDTGPLRGREVFRIRAVAFRVRDEIRPPPRAAGGARAGAPAAAVRAARSSGPPWRRGRARGRAPGRTLARSRPRPFSALRSAARPRARLGRSGARGPVLLLRGDAVADGLAAGAAGGWAGGGGPPPRRAAVLTAARRFRNVFRLTVERFFDTILAVRCRAVMPRREASFRRTTKRPRQRQEPPPEPDHAQGGNPYAQLSPL